MNIDNNKMQVDIENLFKQNVNDLSSIKELYSKLEELGGKITQIKYIDNTLIKKLKKEYEKLKEINFDVDLQIKLNNDIETIKEKLNNDIETINSHLDTIANKGTTVEVLERVTKEEIERQIQDGTLANLTIADGSITQDKLSPDLEFGFNEINDEVKSYLVNYETIECSTSSNENKAMQVFLIDYLIKGKKIISIQKYQTNNMWVGFAIKEDGKIKVIDERNLTGSETGEREINYDIPDGGCYICLKGNVVRDNNGTINFIQLSSTWADGIGEYDMASLPVPVQGYKNFSIKIQKYNSFTQIEEVKNEVNNIKNISDNKVSFGEYSMPVSLNQRMNLVEIFNNDFMIDKYIKTNCTIGTSNVTINQNGQIYYDKDIATDTYKIKFDFKVSDLNTKFGYITEITWNDKFSKTLLDCSKNTITTSFPSEVAAGFNKPDVVTNLDFNIQANTEYTFLVYKNGLTHTISIFDKKSGKKTSQELNLACAWGIGKNGIACEQGSVNITNYGYSMTFPKYAEGIFIGDSITEGLALGTFDISKRWCSLIRDNYFNGNALIFGKGYDISTGALNRLKNLYELNIKSKYVFIMIGTNDSANDDDGYNTWVTNINNIYNLIIEHGAIPIIICPPLTKKPDQIKKMRNYILSNGWNTIRMDIALSKNQDGETYDSTNFTDGVHPNIDGAQKMYERALYDLEMII